MSCLWNDEALELDSRFDLSILNIRNVTIKSLAIVLRVIRKKILLQYYSAHTRKSQNSLLFLKETSLEATMVDQFNTHVFCSQDTEAQDSNNEQVLCSKWAGSIGDLRKVTSGQGSCVTWSTCCCPSPSYPDSKPKGNTEARMGALGFIQFNGKLACVPLLVPSQQRRGN